MRVWVVALFVVAFNLSLSLINTADVFCSITEYNKSDYQVVDGVTYYCCQRYNFDTNSWYCIYNRTWQAPGSPALTQRTEEINSSTISFGSNYFQAWYETMTAIPAFFAVIFGIFTATSDLMITMGFPSYFALTVQTVLNLVVVYGLLQFALGRSGKTIE